MSRPGRNARKARAKMKREPMPHYAVAFTRRQAAEEGLPVLDPKRFGGRIQARKVGDRKHDHRRKRQAA